jgi:hypothetical protein
MLGGNNYLLTNTITKPQTLKIKTNKQINNNIRIELENIQEKFENTTGGNQKPNTEEEQII